MKICIIVTLLVLCSTLHLTQAAGRKKIKSWSTSTTLADSSTSTTTTSTTTTTTTTTSRPLTTRSSEKLSYPKKVQSLKKRPTKSSSTTGGNQLSTKLTQKKRKPTDVTEKFKDLPADDLAFIKELDKQFKLHGDKIKIKVENDNTTSSGKGKNSKRTIEGELGYGYNHNGYNYDPPKFMFYPYSQDDISPDAPGYTPPRAEVEIQPSYSYELHPQSYTVPNEQPQIDLPQVHSGEEQLSHHHQQQQQAPQYDNQQHQHSEEKYSEPVIVLRIPGPAKYASHLQALLQQYLEIRAAQYLRLLEEAELRKQQEEQQQQQQQHHHQQYEQQQQHDYEQQQQQQHYGHQQLSYNSQPAEEDSAQYAPEVAYAHQVAPTPAPVNYPAIDDVYQGYKARKQHAQQHYSQPEEPQAPQQSYYTPEQGYPQAPEEDQQQFYYPQQQQQHQPAEQQYEQEPETGGGPHDLAYQQHVYLISMQPQPGYYSAEQTDEEPQQPQQPVYEHEHPGPSNENNPRDTHTKVVYSPHAPDAAADYNTMYQLPSIRPYERHAPTSMPAYHQQYHQQQQQAESLDYQRVQAAAPEAQQEPINITQRPYNYHAHGLRGRTRGRKRGTAVNTATTGDTEQRLDKIREYVRDKLGAEMGSAVEIKSTHVINRQA